MDDRPVHGLEELEVHLQRLVEAPDTPLNENLIDEVDIQLTEVHPLATKNYPDGNIPPLIRKLLPNLTCILSTYQQDPTILCNLAIKLVRPLPFTQALTLASEDTLIQALLSLAPSANILSLTIIEKAAKSPNDTAIFSIMKSLVEQMIRTWLSTPHVGVGEMATNVLGDLLEMDCDRRSVDTKMNGMSVASKGPPGQGLLWRRIFFDQDIYELILSLTSLDNGNGYSRQSDYKQLSLAQGRVLRVLPRLAVLDFRTVSRTNFPDIEKQYGMVEGERGLLSFAALRMVNKEDMLMHITLIDFFADLLEHMSLTDMTNATLPYLAKLVKKAVNSDTKLYQSLESIAVSSESDPEMVELLVNLDKYQDE